LRIPPRQYDKKNKRTFLKRCEYPTVQLKDLFVGATVSVYSRQLKVVDYADEFTAKSYGPKRSRCLAIVLPDGYEQAGKLIAHITNQNGLGAVLARVKMLRFARAQAEAFYAREQGAAGFAYVECICFPKCSSRGFCANCAEFVCISLSHTDSACAATRFVACQATR
jgi:hypothetical protein